MGILDMIREVIGKLGKRLSGSAKKVAKLNPDPFKQYPQYHIHQSKQKDHRNKRSMQRFQPPMKEERHLLHNLPTPKDDENM